MAAVRISFGVILMVNSINTCLILWITGYDFEIRMYTYSHTHVPYILIHVHYTHTGTVHY